MREQIANADSRLQKTSDRRMGCLYLSEFPTQQYVSRTERGKGRSLYDSNLSKQMAIFQYLDISNNNKKANGSGNTPSKPTTPSDNECKFHHRPFYQARPPLSLPIFMGMYTCETQQVTERE